MPDVVGHSDPDEVKKVRAQYIAIMRTKRRLKNRLEDIEWEYSVLKPGLKSLEQTITVVGELPSFSILDDDEDNG